MIPIFPGTQPGIDILEPTEKQVGVIRLTYDLGLASQDALAGQYGVAQTMISKIVRRESWKHV